MQMVNTNKKQKINDQTDIDVLLAQQLQHEYDATQDNIHHTGTSHSNDTIYRNSYQTSINDGDIIGFHLNYINGIHPRYSIQFNDIADNRTLPIQSLYIINYMIDFHYLQSIIYQLHQINRVIIFHGESLSSRLEHEFNQFKALHKLKNWSIHRVQLSQYSVSHSKLTIMQYATGIRLCISTANLLKIDLEYKNQSHYVQDFPLKSCMSNTIKLPDSTFESDLLSYVQSYRTHNINYDVINQLCGVIKQYCFNYARAQLVYSIPGTYRQSDNTLYHCGHMRIRELLQNQSIQSSIQSNQPIVAQVSSIGNLTQNYINNDLIPSFAAHKSSALSLSSPKLHIVWPTVHDVQTCIEGYAAGSSLCFPHKNRHNYLQFYHYDTYTTGRHNISPHIKTWCRMLNNNTLQYVYTGSANISGAAWGKLQKSHRELMIRSYEIGVLYTGTYINKLIKHIINGDTTDQSVNDILYNSYMNYNITNNNKLNVFISKYGMNHTKSDINNHIITELVLPQPISISDIDLNKLTNPSMMQIINDKLVQINSLNSNAPEKNSNQSDTSTDKHTIRVICPLTHNPLTTPYTANDSAWTWDIPHTQPDLHGNIFVPDTA